MMYPAMKLMLLDAIKVNQNIIVITKEEDLFYDFRGLIMDIGLSLTIISNNPKLLRVKRGSLVSFIDYSYHQKDAEKKLNRNLQGKRADIVFTDSSTSLRNEFLQALLISSNCPVVYGRFV